MLIKSGANAFASAVIFLFSLTLITLSTVRRVNDANLQPKLAIPSTLLSLVSLTTITNIDSNIALWSLVFPIAYFVLLSTYKSNSNLAKILGYSGPVDLSEFNNSRKSSANLRVEPSFDGHSTSIEPAANAIVQQRATTKEREAISLDFSVLLEQVSRHKKLIIAGAASLVVILAVYIGLSGSEQLQSVENDTTDKTSQPTEVIVEEIRNNMVELPDDYQLLTTEHGGLIISWQADFTEQKTLWSQATAKGDKTCESISFNSKTKTRSLRVVVENEENYLAYFSPLDTQSLVRNIAKRSKFKLCDYEFSLKGSQAALSKNSFYRDLF